VLTAVACASTRSVAEPFTAFQIAESTDVATTTPPPECPEPPVFSSTPARRPVTSTVVPTAVFPAAEANFGRNPSGMQCPLCRLDPNHMLFLKRNDLDTSYITPSDTQYPHLIGI